MTKARDQNNEQQRHHQQQQQIDQNQMKYHGTIDLHGCKKSDAISRLTSFMEELTIQHKKKHKQRKSGEVWVLVITGSGAHSQHGPILRTAVQSLFEKRNMTFFLNKGKGAFTVNVNSGYKLYAPELPSCTKVLLTNEQIIRKKSEGWGNSSDRRQAPPNTSNEYSPSLAEVAAENAIIEESKKEYEQEKKIETKEGRLLKRAMSMSKLEAEQQQQEEESEMKKALSLSMIDTTHIEPDDDLRRVLEMSRIDAEIEQEKAEAYDLEEELQKALEMSREQIHTAANDGDGEGESDDAELQRILEKSKLEC